MKISKLIFFLFFLCYFTFPASARESQPVYQVLPLKYREGDKATWKSAGYTNKYWKFLLNDTWHAPEKKHFWLRSDIILDAPGDSFPEAILFLQITAACEVFWNGELLGNNFIGDVPLDSLQARYAKAFRVPADKQNAGMNQLAIRTLLAAEQTLRIGGIELAPSTAALHPPLSKTIFPIILFFIHGILVVYYFRAFLKHPSARHHLFWSAMLFLLTVQSGYSAALLNFDIHYEKVLTFNLMQDYLTLGLYWIIPLFFAYEFQFRFKRTVLIVSILLTIWNHEALLYDRIYQIAGMIPSLLLIAWAIYRQKESALHALFGMLCLIALLFSGFINSLLDVSFLIFILFASITISRRLGVKSKDHEQSMLRSSRLETEMLRKLIQPHYIMNSLNAVIDWLEDEPEKGVEFIHALSDEFRILSRISHEKLVPVEDEIKMCQAHLRIMAFRKEQPYSFRAVDIDYLKSVPPGIFHTIIENGVTHSPHFVDRTDFILKEESLSNGVRYRIINQQADLPESLRATVMERRPMRSDVMVEEPLDEGTGLKYIRARLTESYGENWQINGQAVVGGWETVIEIYNNGAEA